MLKVMQLRYRHILGVLFLSANLALGAAVATWQGQADLTFEATSTLHDFTGTAAIPPFPVQLQWDGPAAILSATARVAVAAMNTQHLKRDRNMRRMFNADTFPLMTGRVKQVRIQPAELQPVPLELTVLGTTRTLPFTLTRWEAGIDRILVQGFLTLSLEELGLKPPVIFGFIRVGDAVTVRIHGRIHPPPP